MTEQNFDPVSMKVAQQVRRGRGRPPIRQRTDDEAAPQVEPRSTRATETRSERRRRKGTGLDANLRFSLPDHLKNDPNWRYHWLVDRPGRISQKTRHDDWEFVEDEEVESDARNTGAGTRIERHAGVDQFGNPLRAYLVRKRKDYDDEDKREHQAALDERMAAIKGGQVTDETGQVIQNGFYAKSIHITENKA